MINLLKLSSFWFFCGLMGLSTGYLSIRQNTLVANAIESADQYKAASLRNSLKVIEIRKRLCKYEDHPGCLLYK